MSRIGKLPISIPQGVEISVDGNKVTVKGKEGVLTQEVNPSIKVNIDKENGHVTFDIDETYDPINVTMKQKQAYHGLYRSLINNMVVGVSEGYEKQLELVGVGYRVSNKGNLLEFALGYTHPIYLMLPSEIKVETKSERNQNPLIILKSCDKQLLGQVCAKIRTFRKPEPYKGKGILFVGEQIRRKSGKSAGAK
ncbi:MAG: 50S ribosomal protein L6 [Bacteroidaceae bacterium]|nr:50S ribosomal protein L6 [Bacteroidaceae bacterium]